MQCPPWAFVTASCCATMYPRRKLPFRSRSPGVMIPNISTIRRQLKICRRAYGLRPFHLWLRRAMLCHVAHTNLSGSCDATASRYPMTSRRQFRKCLLSEQGCPSLVLTSARKLRVPLLLVCLLPGRFIVDPRSEVQSLELEQPAPRKLPLALCLEFHPHLGI